MSAIARKIRGWEGRSPRRQDMKWELRCMQHGLPHDSAIHNNKRLVFCYFVCCSWGRKPVQIGASSWRKANYHFISLRPVYPLFKMKVLTCFTDTSSNWYLESLWKRWAPFKHEAAAQLSCESCWWKTTWFLNLQAWRGYLFSSSRAEGTFTEVSLMISV